MTRVITSLLAGLALLPRCGPALNGQVAADGCQCDYETGGLLSGSAAGWRWTCDLLRGPGMSDPVPGAGVPAAGLPPGFTYAPPGSQPGYAPPGYDPPGYASPVGRSQFGGQAAVGLGY